MSRSEKIMIITFSVLLAAVFYGVHKANYVPPVNPLIARINNMVDEVIITKEDNTLVATSPESNCLDMLYEIVVAEPIEKPKEPERCIYGIKMVKDGKDNGTIYVHPTYTEVLGTTVKTTFKTLTFIHNEWVTWSGVSVEEIHNYDK